MVEAYVSLRKLGEDPRSNERRITATTRQLESMIRLSEAHARMRFSATVDKADVEEANRLIRSAIKESATDPATGLLDLDLLLDSGGGAADRRRTGDLKQAILEVLVDGKRLRWSEALRALEAQSSVPIDQHDFNTTVQSMINDGQIQVSGEKQHRTLRRTDA